MHYLCAKEGRRFPFRFEEWEMGLGSRVFTKVSRNIKTILHFLFWKGYERETVKKTGKSGGAKNSFFSS